MNNAANQLYVEISPIRPTRSRSAIVDKLMKTGNTFLLNSRDGTYRHNHFEDEAKNTPVRTRRERNNAVVDMVSSVSPTSSTARSSRSQAGTLDSSGSAKENDTISTPSLPARHSTRSSKLVESSPSQPNVERILSPKSAENLAVLSPSRQNITKDTKHVVSSPKKSLSPKKTIQPKKSRLVKMNFQSTHRTRRAIAEDLIMNNIITRKRLSSDKILNPIRKLIKPKFNSNRSRTTSVTRTVGNSGIVSLTISSKKNSEVATGSTTTTTNKRELPQRTRIPVIRKK